MQVALWAVLRSISRDDPGDFWSVSVVLIVGTADYVCAVAMRGARTQDRPLNACRGGLNAVCFNASVRGPGDAALEGARQSRGVASAAFDNRGHVAVLGAPQVAVAVAPLGERALARGLTKVRWKIFLAAGSARASACATSTSARCRPTCATRATWRPQAAVGSAGVRWSAVRSSMTTPQALDTSNEPPAWAGEQRAINCSHGLAPGQSPSRK